MFKGLTRFLFEFCSFYLQVQNKNGTCESRQSISSRNFNKMIEGLRSSHLELKHGQKFNPSQSRG